MIYIGIDPGASGAIASLDLHGNVDAEKFTGKTYIEIAQLIRRHVKYSSRFVIALEKVHAMPARANGKTVQGIVGTFAFGKNYGVLVGILATLDIEPNDVPPQTWQKEFGLIVRRKQPGITAGKAKTIKKNLHKAKAQELFPSVKVTHAVADALLIAEYLRRLERGE